MGRAKGNNALFAHMIRVGDLLIEAQALEQNLARICSRRHTPKDLADWQESRRWVEVTAHDYALAIREWRESIEAQMVRNPSPPFSQLRLTDWEKNKRSDGFPVTSTIGGSRIGGG